MRDFVTRPGFEPRPSEPESEILPLYYRAMERKCIAINVSEEIVKTGILHLRSVSIYKRKHFIKTLSYMCTFKYKTPAYATAFRFRFYIT